MPTKKSRSYIDVNYRTAERLVRARTRDRVNDLNILGFNANQHGRRLANWEGGIRSGGNVRATDGGRRSLLEEDALVVTVVMQARDR